MKDESLIAKPGQVEKPLVSDEDSYVESDVKLPRSRLLIDSATLKAAYETSEDTDWQLSRLAKRRKSAFKDYNRKSRLIPSAQILSEIGTMKISEVSMEEKYESSNLVYSALSSLT
ncbi:hypothetical protein GJ496_005187 [Pomphorhynchus laevis]|nr:hypothetical protein GJ496_005187 [Pomphorhynchus laevis]